MSNQQDRSEGSRPYGSSSLIDRVVDQAQGDLSSVVLGGTEQECLLQALAGVPDPRGRRGRRHRLAGTLALMVAAVLAGKRSFYAIGQWAADARPRTLKRVGARRDPASGQWMAPDEATFRRLATVLDPAAFEAALGSVAGRTHPPQAGRPGSYRP